MNNTIIIAEDYTKYPGLRYEYLTPNISGEKLRDEFLIPALENNESIVVVMDGNIGQYIPSFLEECFAGIIRKKKYSMEEFKSKVKIISNDDPELINEIYHYVSREIK